MTSRKYIEMSPREAALALITIAALCLIIGALFGAVRSAEERSTELADCETRTAARCMIVAVPIFPSYETNGTAGESPNVP